MNSMINKMTILLIMALLAGCGGGGNAFTQSGGSSSGSSGGSSGGNSAGGSISLSLTDSSSTATTSISADSPGTLRATVVDAKGGPISGAVVTFATNLATFNPTAGSALTNSSGIATVTLLAGTQTGADNVTASAIVGGSSSTLTASKGYTVVPQSLSLSSLSIGISSLSANGTTSLTISVLDKNGAPYATPVDITFASNCSAIGKATISSPITTVNGVATSNYLDKGCANTDIVTASMTLGGTTVSKTASLIVNPATAGSIQYVSAQPQNIAIKGTGGSGRQENSTVTFKVVDSGGNPVPGVTVNFSLSTSVGGIALLPTSASTDAQGNVATVVSSGTVATAVRAIATIANSSPILSTQSDQMSITTGIPSQDHFSLSASSQVIQGWNHDNVCSVMTVIASDHFGNPVPDGTAINFTAEGGQVGADCASCGNPKYCESGGTCHTVNGLCRSIFVSSEPRPTNGRVTVLAYGIGEEGFTDKDGDGYVSSPSELVDANGVSTDMPEAFVDDNEDGSHDVNERFFDFNSNGIYDGTDGLYNGVLCKPGGAWCSTTSKSINIRDESVILLVTDYAIIKATDSNPINNPDVFNTNPLDEVNPFVLDSCKTNVAWAATDNPRTLYLQITDLHGNALPAGTKVDVSSTNGKVVVAPSSPLADSIDCVSGDSQFAGCPYSPPHSTFSLTLFTLVMTSDATQSGSSSPYTCTNSSPSGYLTIKVTTPGPSNSAPSETDKIIKITD